MKYDPGPDDWLTANRTSYIVVRTFFHGAKIREAFNHALVAGQSAYQILIHFL
jgi:hypothetical protein